MAFDLAEAYVVIRARTAPLERDLARAESLVESSVSRLNALATLGKLPERAGTTGSATIPVGTNEVTTPVEVGIRPAVDAQQAARAMRELYHGLGARTGEGGLPSLDVLLNLRLDSNAARSMRRIAPVDTDVGHDFESDPSAERSVPRQFARELAQQQAIREEESLRNTPARPALPREFETEASARDGLAFARRRGAEEVSDGSFMRFDAASLADRINRTAAGPESNEQSLRLDNQRNQALKEILETGRAGNDILRRLTNGAVAQ